MRTPTRLSTLCAVAAAVTIATLFPAAAQEPAPGTPSIPGTINDPNIPSSGAVVLAPEEGPLVIPGDTPDIIFEFTGKVMGYVEPCG